MKRSSLSLHRGFTLLETVIAIGVLAVLLTGFMLVFTPAAQGIRTSINVQQADRLASALEMELVTLRQGDTTADINTGFDKAFDRIKNSANSSDALAVYQYRADLTSPPRQDGTLEPVPSTDNKLPGSDYIVVPMVRKVDDPLFATAGTGDLAAVEGAVYVVKCTQLVFGSGSDGGLSLGEKGKIIDPKGSDDYSNASAYPEAVIAFAADFYMMPAKTSAYFSGGGFKQAFEKLKNPVLTRNLAVRR